MIFMCALILCCYQHLFSFIFNRLLCIKAHLLGIGKEGTKTFRYLTKSFLHSLVPNIFEPAYRFSSTHLLHLLLPPNDMVLRQMIFEQVLSVKKSVIANRPCSTQIQRENAS